MLGGFPYTSKSVTAMNCSNTSVSSFVFLSKLIYHPLLLFPQAQNFFWIPKSCFYQELFSMASEKSNYDFYLTEKWYPQRITTQSPSLFPESI